MVIEWFRIFKLNKFIVINKKSNGNQIQQFQELLKGMKKKEKKVHHLVRTSKYLSL